MGAAQPTVDQKKNSNGTSTVGGLVLRLALLALIDTFAIIFIFNLLGNNSLVLAVAVGIITVFFNVVVFRNDLFPIRWMVLGLVFMAMFALYPIIYTVFISFTNWGQGNLVSKEQAIELIENVKYLPEGGADYTWTAYVSDDGDFAVWLQNSDGQGFFALPDKEIVAVNPGEQGVGELDEDGIPLTIDGYERLNRLTVLRFIDALGEVSLGEGDRVARIQGMDGAAELEQKYVYDSETDTMTDQETGVVYTPVEGTFTSETGQTLSPGYQVCVGVENFVEFFTSPALRGPLVRIITWNFVFAFLSVGMTFFMGLGVALIFNDHTMPGRKLITTLLLIPYTIPSLITIMVWRGMLNPELGIVNRVLEDLIGWAPNWFASPFWAKAAILIVNLWLGYPYFMLVCSGALQAIPDDIYNAAEVDGANMWQRFRKITLPLLLVAIGPLLVASYIFNFNNFNIIFLFIAGGPPIAGAATNAGHTDILISYVYNLAFAGGRGAQYGFAAAITMIVFVLVAVMTLLQFRYTKMWEEVGENV